MVSASTLSMCTHRNTTWKYSLGLNICGAYFCGLVWTFYSDKGGLFLYIHRFMFNCIADGSNKTITNSFLVRPGETPSTSSLRMIGWTGKSRTINHTHLQVCTYSGVYCPLTVDNINTQGTRLVFCPFVRVVRMDNSKLVLGV